MFYNRFLELCERNGISPTRVVVALGMSRGNLSRWRDGGEPRNEFKKQIADYFGITVDELMRGGTTKAPAPKDERKISEEELKIALFGGSEEVTNEMWEEAQFAAQLIKERHKRKKHD